MHLFFIIRWAAKAAGYKEDVGDAVLVEGDILMSKEEYENTKKG